MSEGRRVLNRYAKCGFGATIVAILVLAARLTPASTDGPAPDGQAVADRVIAHLASQQPNPWRRIVFLLAIAVLSSGLALWANSCHPPTEATVAVRTSNDLRSLKATGISTQDRWTVDAQPGSFAVAASPDPSPPPGGFATDIEIPVSAASCLHAASTLHGTCRPGPVPELHPDRLSLSAANPLDVRLTGAEGRDLELNGTDSDTYTMLPHGPTRVTVDTLGPPEHIMLGVDDRTVTLHAGIGRGGARSLRLRVVLPPDMHLELFGTAELHATLPARTAVIGTGNATIAVDNKSRAIAGAALRNVTVESSGASAFTFDWAPDRPRPTLRTASATSVASSAFGELVPSTYDRHQDWWLVGVGAIVGLLLPWLYDLTVPKKRAPS